MKLSQTMAYALRAMVSADRLSYMTSFRDDPPYALIHDGPHAYEHVKGRTVHALERRGLVEVDRAPDGRGSWDMRVTDRGREVVA